MNRSDRNDGVQPVATNGGAAGIRIGTRPAEAVIPAFNIPYVPTMEPVVAALRHTRLHLDHVPVVDEDGQEVDFEVVHIPLVLRGGSGIQKKYILGATPLGIAMIDIGTAIRRAYQDARSVSEAAAQQAVFDTTVSILTGELELKGSRRLVNPEA